MRQRIAAALIITGVAAVVGVAVATPAPTAGLAHAPADNTLPPPSLWTTDWGGFNHFGRLLALGPNSVWGVGSNLVHFDGTRWTVADQRDYPGQLKGIDVTPDGFGWAVGDNEEAIPIVAGVAGPSIRVPGYRLRDVAVVARDEALALATYENSSLAVILRYQGGEWRPSWTAPRGVGFSTIWAASATEAWVAGSSAAMFDGTTWTEWPLPPGVEVNELAGTTMDDVWGVGGPLHSPQHPDFLPPHRYIVHFDGRGWRVVSDEPKSAIWAIDLRGEEGIAVAIDGAVLSREGDDWVETGASIPHTNFPLDGFVTTVTYVPGTDYALVGDYEGWVYRVEAAEVSLVHDAATFHSVGVLSSAKGWALGRDVLEYDGEKWTAGPSELAGATDISVAGPDEAWAVGPGSRVLHYQGGAWSAADSSLSAELRRVVADRSGAVWLLGKLMTADGEPARSVAYRRLPSGGWSEAWQGDGDPRDLAVSDSTTAIATSDAIWLSDGTAWRRVRNEWASSVGLGPSGEVWAATYGSLAELRGASWEHVLGLPGDVAVFAFARGAHATWAVANVGFVAAYQDGTWRIVRGDPDSNGVAGALYGLEDVAAVEGEDGSTTLWAVGAPDTIIHAREDDVLGLPTIIPQPTFDFPDYEYDVAYLPALHVTAHNRSAACATAPGAASDVVLEEARRTATFFAQAGPQPEPVLRRFHMLTAAEADAQYGTQLVGATVHGREVAAGECIWWATFAGRFDCQCGAGTPGGYEWTRMDLALFRDDASVLYQEFSGQAPVATPPPVPTPTPRAAMR